MTIVNATSIFKKSEFKEMIEDHHNSILDTQLRTYIENSLKDVDYSEGVDYNQLLKIKNQLKNKWKLKNDNPWKRD